MTRNRSHDDYLNEALKDPTEAALYLNAIAEDHDPALLLEALAKVARAHGLSRMSRRAEMSRMGLYKMLSRNGNPEFKTFFKVLDASGLRLFFKPSKLAA